MHGNRVRDATAGERGFRNHELRVSDDAAGGATSHLLFGETSSRRLLDSG
jgi:hypothetical protein